MKKSLVILLFISFLLLIGCSTDFVCKNEGKPVYEKNTDWTIMHYCAGDSNGLATDLCCDIEEIVKGYSGNCNVLILIDVAENQSCTIFEETFSGTCIFRVEKGKLVRISLDEIYQGIEKSINSADTDVLKNFIFYCKKNYPAKYYGLFLGGHGNGVGSAFYSNIIQKNILYDGDKKQWICAVDLTTNLEENCSVDFLGLDLCYMGSMEFLYQIRVGNGGFSTKYVTASAPEVWGMGLDYSRIYNNFIPDITPKNFANLVVKSQDEYTKTSDVQHSLKSKQSLIACDLSKVDNVKQKFDILCNVLTTKKELAESVRGKSRLNQSDITHYFSSMYSTEWKYYPYFDLYDFVFLLGEKDEELKEISREVCEAIDELILDSFGRDFYTRFIPGKMGLSIFYPNFTLNGCSWDYMMWNKVSSSGNECYGNLSWNKDNAGVGNWFTLLESWYKN